MGVGFQLGQTSAGKREQGWSVQAGLSLKVVAGSWERAEDSEWSWGGVLGSPVL